MALISIALFRAGNGIAAIWFANAVGIAALSQLIYSRWPLVLLMLAISLMLANWLMGSPLAVALLFLPGNLLEVAVGAYLLRRYWRDSAFFFSLSDVFRFIWLGVCIPVLLGGALSWGIFVANGMMATERVFIHWVEGSAIGGVSVLPAAYWITLRGRDGLKQLLSNRFLPASLILAVAVALLVPMLLPFPFIYVSLPLFYIAYQSGVAGTAIANMLVAMSICVLIELGLLLPPPTIYSWGYALFYLPVFATLIPPLLLAVTMDMNRSAAIALQQSERRYRSLYQQTPAMMYSCADDGTILTVNDIWLNKMGYQPQEVIERLATDFLSPESLQWHQTEFLQRLHEKGNCQDVRQQLINKRGEIIDVLTTAVAEKDELNQSLRILVVQLDISDKVRAENLAYHDALTQLPNRLLFADRLKQACQHYSRVGGGFVVAFVDLDYFKEVNDNFGHEIGDLLLIEVARRLESAVRSSDTVSRLGGDEFVLLLGGLVPGEEAEQIAEKIRKTIADPYRLNSHPVQISASIGLAYFPNDGQDEITLMRNADDAMYKAKHTGRNCCMTATQS